MTNKDETSILASDDIASVSSRCPLAAHNRTIPFTMVDLTENSRDAVL